MKYVGELTLRKLITKIKDCVKNKEDIANKTTVLSSDCSDTQYPSAKAVNDKINQVVGDINTLLDSI